MPHILKSQNLEIHIDLPYENYQNSRFDWSGKIQKVVFEGSLLTITEKNDDQLENLFGKGLYNEFGIESALGFEEANIGEWFHKIGIGLLKKNDVEYHYHKNFEIQPAKFEVNYEPGSIIIICTSNLVNGYAYILKKKIELVDCGFTITYLLENIGEKDIITDEYTHNFLAINNEPINSNYKLSFPFPLLPDDFEEFTDPEKKIILSKNCITFSSKPVEQFFIGQILGDKPINAQWELINSDQKIGIRETGNIRAIKVNIWGCEHVISPELVHHIHLKSGESSEWTRKYHVFNTD